MPKQPVVFVVTADQVRSRRGKDAVPNALESLAHVHPATDGDRTFARTAGDEIQGVVTQASTLLDVVQTLARDGRWRIGIGVGSVQRPVAEDVRAATGEAFYAAREAVTASRAEPQRLSVRRATPDSSHDADGGALDLQAALTMLLTIWHRRSEAGWQTAELLDAGAATTSVAHQLGVTPSAVSQRARAAMVEEARAGRQLAERLAHRLTLTSRGDG